MAITDIYEIKLHGLYDGLITTLNVFHYQQTIAGTYDPEDVLEAFDVMLFETADLLAATSTAMQYTLLEVLPVSDETQPIFGASLNRVGTIVGDCLPPTQAYGFRYHPLQLHRRSGYKRFCGVPETSQVNGKYPSPSTITTWGDAVASNLSLPFATFVDDIEYTPVILSRVLNGEPRPTPIPTQISQVVFQTIVSTQNTRKK